MGQVDIPGERCYKARGTPGRNSRGRRSSISSGEDMSKLSDLVNKGVRLIVTDAAEGEAPEVPREKEIPAEAFEAPPPRAARSAVPSTVEDFGAVYAEAGIAPPPHGYGIDKVAEMLESKRLAPLGKEVKATAVLAALEAAQVG